MLTSNQANVPSNILKQLIFMLLMLHALTGTAQRISLDDTPSFTWYSSNAAFKSYLTADTVSILNDSLVALGYRTSLVGAVDWYLYSGNKFNYIGLLSDIQLFGNLIILKYPSERFRILRASDLSILDSSAVAVAQSFPWLTLTKRDSGTAQKVVFNAHSAKKVVDRAAGGFPESFGIRMFKSFGKIGGLNLRGDTILPFEFKQVTQVGKGYLLGSKSGDGMGTYKFNGCQVYPDTFKSLQLLANDLLLVKSREGFKLTDLGLHELYGGLCDSFEVHQSGWLTQFTDSGSFFISPKGCRIGKSRLSYGLSDPEYLLVRNGPHWEIYNDQAELTSFGFENINPGYRYIGSRSEGLYPTNQEGRMGAISIEGLKRLGQRYDSVCHFQEGRAAVKLQLQDSWGGWGFINKKDSLSVQPIYDSVSSYCDGLALVKRNQAYNVLDLNAKTLLPAQVSQIRSDNCGGFLFKVNGRWGYLSADGEQVLLPKFQVIRTPDCNTLIYQSLSGKWGMKRKQPQLEVEAIYDRIVYDPVTQNYLLWQDKWGQ